MPDIMPSSNQEDQKFAKGNPRLPPPEDAGGIGGTRKSATIGKENRKRKKLIVLCDGTGEDNLSSNGQNPTNVTRLARALCPNAWVKNDDGEYEEWEQIVSYHAGIGTFEGNALFGVMFGTGLSEIVRAAYGFLANNWENGDKIYVFGFSRGAYIARSIAGLVAQHGLLTKRGMDNFHAVYETFYNNEDDTSEQDDEDDNTPIIDTQAGGKISKKDAGLRPVQPGTVEVVGVFDTVAFHNPITAWLNKKLHSRAFDTNDRNEFQNTTLHKNVRYAFHALSLDESRIPFQTTLFFKDPKDQENGMEWDTTLKQVWFSGAHSDVGGGFQDSRLSNIALGWMISELEQKKLLAFDRNYLIDPDSIATEQHPTFWGTYLGPNKDEYSNPCENPWHFWHKASYNIEHGFLKCLKGAYWLAAKVTLFIGLTAASRWLSGVRTPGEYIPIVNHKHDPSAKHDFETCEELHESIKDRGLGKVNGLQKPEGACEWPCAALKGFGKEGKFWVKREGKAEGDKGVALPNMAPLRDDPDPAVHDIEMTLRGRMRFEGRVLKPWLAGGKIPHQIHAVPIVNPAMVGG